MVYAFCFLENVAKHCLKRIGTERSHHYGCRNESKLFVYFRITGCNVQVFSNLVEIIYELKLNRDSLCSLKIRFNKGENSFKKMPSVWIDFGLEVCGLRCGFFSEWSVSKQQQEQFNVKLVN